MDKIDYRRKYHDLYSPPSGTVQQVTVPPLTFAMIDGKGAAEGPEQSPEFQDAISALYGLAYTLKMTRKKAGIAPDYTIAPLEGLWWMAGGGPFDMERPADWRWTLMMLQPEFITPADFKAAIATLKAKQANPSLGRLHLEKYDEGPALQIMHIGPYATEAADIALLQAFAAEHQLIPSGKHHEIYLGDPRRSKPEKLKTILRQPVQPIR